MNQTQQQNQQFSQPSQQQAEETVSNHSNKPVINNQPQQNVQQTQAGEQSPSQPLQNQIPSQKNQNQVFSGQQTSQQNVQQISESPQTETPQPTVLKPEQRESNKKVLVYSALGLGSFVIAFATYLILGFVIGKGKSQKMASDISATPSSKENSEEKHVPIQLPSEIEPPKIKGDFALSVNDQKIEWDDYQEILDYQLKQRDVNSVNQDEYRSETLKNILIERLLLFETAEEKGYQPTKEELFEAEKSYFGTSIPNSLKSDPQTQTIIQAEAYKQKVIEELVSWVSGGSMVVEKGGPTAIQTAEKKGKNVQALARDLIEPYYQKAKNGVSVEEIHQQAWKDKELLEFNRSPQMHLFEKYTQDKFKTLWEDPNSYQILFSLSEGETSDIFNLKHPNDKEKDIWVDYGFCFIKAEQVHQGEYDSYQKWLDSEIESAEIISNI